MRGLTEGSQSRGRSPDDLRETKGVNTMRFSTTQIRSVLNHIAATGVLFEPDEAVEDLEGVLAKYGLSASLSFTEHYALVRELEHIAATGETLFDPSQGREADLGPDGDDDPYAQGGMGDLESLVRTEEDQSDLDALIPPIHPDYMPEDDEAELQARPRLPREYPTPDPYLPEYDGLYDAGDSGYGNYIP